MKFCCCWVSERNEVFIVRDFLNLLHNILDCAIYIVLMYSLKIVMNDWYTQWPIPQNDYVENFWSKLLLRIVYAHTMYQFPSCGVSSFKKIISLGTLCTNCWSILFIFKISFLFFSLFFSQTAWVFLNSV